MPAIAKARKRTNFFVIADLLESPMNSLSWAEIVAELGALEKNVRFVPKNGTDSRVGGGWATSVGKVLREPCP
jgi:hypothetical protein